MKEGKYPILKQIFLAEKIYQMDILCPDIADEANPGQFVNLYCHDQTRLLPRPISLYDIDRENGILRLIYAVVGAGTEEFSTYQDGEIIRMVGPLGHGFPLEKAQAADEVLLVGGGLGIPPMYALGKALHEADPETPIRSFLGFRSEPWILEPFQTFSDVYPSSDDGACGFRGHVLDRIRAKIDGSDGRKRVLYACGPVPMMKVLQQAEDEFGFESYFSLEERMGCGFGACAGCPVKIRTPDGSVVQQGVCKIGPVFRGKDVIFS